MADESSYALSRSVRVDDNGVLRRLADGTEESVTWAELSTVVIRVIPDSPWSEDVFFMLAGPNGTGTAIPSGDPAADALLERLQMLPGFDQERFVDAMTIDADEAYLVWNADRGN